MERTTQMENNFVEFLMKSGFSNVIKPLEVGGIYTLEAFLCVSVEDLVEELKIGKIAAKALLSSALAYSTQQNPSSQNQNNQLTTLPPEAIIAINEAQNAAKNQKHQHELELMKFKFEYELKISDLKIQNLQNEIKMEQLKTEIEKTRAEEKEKAFVEEKRKNEKIPIRNLYSRDGVSLVDSVLMTLSHHEFLQRNLPSPRKWILLYRGSRDGFSASSFHIQCDGRGPTITLVKSEYIFGGYNPSSWTNNHQKASGSFLFCLTNAWSSTPLIFPWRRNHGPCGFRNYGPTFGQGHDLHISHNCNSNQSSYSNFPYSYSDTLGKGPNTFAGSKYFRDRKSVV